MRLRQAEDEASTGSSFDGLRMRLRRAEDEASTAQDEVNLAWA
jgi:hypothetical protein